MRESTPANTGNRGGRRFNRLPLQTAGKGTILATAHYLLAPEDTSPGAGPALLPAPLRGLPLAAQAFKAPFWIGAAVGLGLAIARLD